MSLILHDLQKLQEDTESRSSVEGAGKAHGGKFAMNRWTRQPSSILICCLSALCAGLLFIIIILALILTRQEMDRTAQNTHYRAEQPSKNDSTIMETMAAIGTFLKDLRGQRLDQMEQNMAEKVKTLILEVNTLSERLSPDGPLSGDIQKILRATRKLEEGLQKAYTDRSSDIQRNLGASGNSTEEEQRKNQPADPTCSIGWKKHGHSCYVLSSNTKPWKDAKKECEDVTAHLVVINDGEEMDFLRGFVKVSDVWIGLSDVDGDWKWVDGTSYDLTPTFWEEKQPDNWTDHGLGGGEDCVELRNKEKWNDDHCSRNFQYVCEKKLF